MNITWITQKTWRFACTVALIGCMLFMVNACKKNNHAASAEDGKSASDLSVHAPFNNNEPQTFILAIANIRHLASGETEIMFCRKEQVFLINDATLLPLLQGALAAAKPVKVTVNPWTKQVIAAALAPDAEAAKLHRALQTSSVGTTMQLGSANYTDAMLDNVDGDKMLPSLADRGTGGTALTSMIPDMATAQLIFNYITKQCCALAGPYAIDYCISFQYCEDGCYARAHKMCWIMNNKFHYATQKVFSFANAGSDELCVQGQKWGGCCINWWYHVAPLVTIKTPAGPKAFVFDPAMFDQPVLLSAWLHAQENPVCAGSRTPHVTMVAVQPTSSYSPAIYAGTAFDTDSSYADTDTTLVHYSRLVTCP